MENFEEFKFDRRSLSTPRKPGISAILRVKNGEHFLRLSILSHIDYYDEIIACYNDCSDNTVQILHDLAEQYPQKIKIYHYVPKVHPPLTDEHDATPTESVHGMANYSNYAISKATYSVITKLDDDHLAIPQNLAPAINIIRQDIAANKKTLWYFSGINLICDGDANIGVAGHNPFAGIGDVWYVPIDKIVFRQIDLWEDAVLQGTAKVKKYLGILFFHLKFLKPNFGYDNLSPQGVEWCTQHFGHLDRFHFIPFDVFRTRKYIGSLQRKYSVLRRMRFFLGKIKHLPTFIWKNVCAGRGIDFNQLLSLENDLANIDFKGEVVAAILCMATHGKSHTVTDGKYHEVIWRPTSDGHVISDHLKPHEKPTTISVVMSAYNAERYIAEAIQSILDQTFEDFEFIILNDGSTDHTAEVIGGFTDRRIVFIDEAKNGGLAKCLNQGFAMAKGTFIARMDADDWSFPQRFEKQVAYMEANPDICVLATSIAIVKNSLDKIKKIDSWDVAGMDMLLTGNIFTHSSIMIRRLLLPTGVCYSDAYPHAEDYKLWLDLLPLARMETLKEPLIKYRKHSHSVSKIYTTVQIRSEIRAKMDFIQRYLQTEIPIQHQAAWQWMAWNDTTIRLAQLIALCSFLEGTTLAVRPVGTDNITLTPKILRLLIKQQIKNRVESLKHHIFDKVDVVYLRWYYEYKIKAIVNRTSQR